MYWCVHLSIALYLVVCKAVYRPGVYWCVLVCTPVNSTVTVPCCVQVSVQAWCVLVHLSIALYLVVCKAVYRRVHLSIALYLVVCKAVYRPGVYWCVHLSIALYLVLCKAVYRPGVYICHRPDTLTNVHVVDLECLVGTAHQNYVFMPVKLLTGAVDFHSVDKFTYVFLCLLNCTEQQYRCCMQGICLIIAECISERVSILTMYVCMYVCMYECMYVCMYAIRIITTHVCTCPSHLGMFIKLRVSSGPLKFY